MVKVQPRNRLPIRLHPLVFRVEGVQTTELDLNALQSISFSGAYETLGAPLSEPSFLSGQVPSFKVCFDDIELYLTLEEVDRCARRAFNREEVMKLRGHFGDFYLAGCGFYDEDGECVLDQRPTHEKVRLLALKHQAEFEQSEINLAATTGCGHKRTRLL